MPFGSSALPRSDLRPTSPTKYSRPSSPSKSSTSSFGQSEYIAPPLPLPKTPSETSRFYSASASSTTSACRFSPVRRATSPRTPLGASVGNIVAAWKDRAPGIGKSAGKKSAEPQIQSSFSIRRESSLSRNRSQNQPSVNEPATGGPIRDNKNGDSEDKRDSRGSADRSSGPAFSLNPSDFGSNLCTDQEPIRIGLLWYLDVHTEPPCRWVRTRAILYSNMLVLSWIAPSGGRGVVTLDLLNCTEVSCPSHRDARDDIGSIAALTHDAQGKTPALTNLLCPFQLLYSDGVERLGAESAQERVRWVSVLWEVLSHESDASTSYRSASPAPSFLSIPSIPSVRSRTSEGSASTFYEQPDVDYMHGCSPHHSLENLVHQLKHLLYWKANRCGHLSRSPTPQQNEGGCSFLS